MMIDNSGFLSNDSEFTQISTSFCDVEILGRSATNVYGRANRFGKRWFFKGVSADVQDVAMARQQLLKEFDIQIQLNHPAIARVISFENIKGIGQSIVTEWIEGESLDTLLNKSSITHADRLRILTEIVDAVSYLHTQGIVHRDLKPSNIMIRQNGQSAVIIDFGLADTDAHLYQKLPAGTEGYASRRQHHAHTPFTGDDIHALGVIIQQLCPRLHTIAHRCRDGRYPTAESLRLAIEQRKHRRRIMSWLSGATLLLILITSLIIYIASLQKNTAILQNDIEAMTDSLISLRSTSQATNAELHDSLATVTQHLDNEKTIRHNRELRQSQINNIKTGLNQRLDRVYANFRKTEDKANTDNQSLIRLIDLLTLTKNEYFAKEIPFELTDAEQSELNYSYITRYNNILKEWNQTLSQYNPNNSAD